MLLARCVDLRDDHVKRRIFFLEMRAAIGEKYFKSLAGEYECV